MNAASNVTTTLAALRAQAASKWRLLAPRERRMVLAAGLLVSVALVWMVLVRPAWRTLQEVPKQIDVLDLQLQQMQGFAAEARLLREQPRVNAAQADEALRAATSRLGPQARLSIQSDRATLTLNDVPGAALASWFGEVRSAARARPLEAQLTHNPNGYSGTVVLGLARGG